MGRLELYKYDEKYGLYVTNDVLCERKYGLGGGGQYIQKIWIDLEKKYLPPTNSNSKISRVHKSDESGWWEIWNLVSSDKLKEYEKSVLKSTFDYSFLKYENIKKFIEDLKLYINEHGTNETFETLVKALQYQDKLNDSKYFGIFDSVSGINHLEVDIEDFKEEFGDNVEKTLNENEKYLLRELDKETIFLNLEFYEKEFPENFF